MSKTLAKANKPNWKGLTAALVAAFVIGAAYVGTQAARRVSGPRLYLSPSSQNLTVGNNVSVQIRADSGATLVNAVQANLTYPSDKFDFVDIVNAGSAFEVSAAATGGNGTVTIARGATTAVSGDQVVATVNFKVKAKGTATVNFADGSVLVSSSSSADILKSFSGGTYRIR